MDKFKALILLPGLNLFGQEKALIKIADSLSEKNVPAIFLLHNDWGQDIAKELKKKGYTFFFLPLGNLWSISLLKKDPMLFFRNIFSIISSSIRFNNLVSHTKATHLISGNTTFTFYILPSLIFSKIYFIFRFGDEPATHSFFHRFLNKILFCLADSLIVNCNFLKNKIAIHYPKLKTELIYNTPLIFKSIKKNIRKSKCLEKKNKNFLYIGQISKEKGILVLAEAFTKALIYNKNITLTIVGKVSGIAKVQDNGPLNIIKKLKKEYPQNIFLHDFNVDCSLFYLNSSVHICPSIEAEPSANVIFEAKFYGLPSIIFDVGGLGEIITHKVNGYICQEISTESLFKAISYYALADSRQISIQGKKAHANLMKEFSLKRFTNQWLSVFQRTQIENDCINK
jgi:glycosyltransferase involved in cell wall biosynthesis